MTLLFVIRLLFFSFDFDAGAYYIIYEYIVEEINYIESI